MIYHSVRLRLPDDFYIWEAALAGIAEKGNYQAEVRLESNETWRIMRKGATASITRTFDGIGAEIPAMISIEDIEMLSTHLQVARRLLSATQAARD
jgi:hypothetical protein